MIIYLIKDFINALREHSKELRRMSQSTDNLTAAVQALSAETPAIVTAIQATVSGLTDVQAQALADQINTSLTTIKAAIPTPPAG